MKNLLLFPALFLVACSLAPTPSTPSPEAWNTTTETPPVKTSIKDEPPAEAKPLTKEQPAVPATNEEPLPVEPTTSVTPAGGKLGDYGLVFKVNTGLWTNQVVIAPWGDVVVIGGHEARLLARDSGKVLLQVPICFTQAPDAAAFVDEHHLLVACDERIDELTFPQGTVKEVFKFPVKAEATAIGGGRVAFAPDGFWVKNDNRVRVYAIPGFAPVDEFDPGAPVSAVSISSDGRFVVAGLDDKGGFVVRNTSVKSSKKYLKASDTDSSPVRFSPDASAVFTYSDSFTGGEVNLASGEVNRSFKVSSWIKTVRYIDANKILLTGAHGLALGSGRDTLVESPADDLGEGLDLSSDGSFFCAAGRGGKTACFSNRPVAPSTYVPWQGPGSGPSPTPSTSPAPVSVSIDGEIVSRTGTTVVLAAQAANEAKPGMRGQLSRHFSQNIGIEISGQVVIAVVAVKQVGTGTITLNVIEEKSKVTVNGKNVDHFAPKTAVTLELD